MYYKINSKTKDYKGVYRMESRTMEPPKIWLRSSGR